MSRSTISQTASRDLVEILDYFANINIKAGESFIQEFKKKMQKHSKFSQYGA